jgi:hypothetical protein
MKTERDFLLGGPSLPVETASEHIRRKMQRAVPLLRLLLGETIALFMAGVAAPSFLRSGIATNHALPVGSLHTLALAGVPFTYRFKDLAFAILGALCGAAIALALDSSGAIPEAARVLRTRPRDWKCLFPEKAGENARWATGNWRRALLRALPGDWAGSRMGLRPITNYLGRQP